MSGPTTPCTTSASARSTPATVVERRVVRGSDAVRLQRKLGHVGPEMTSRHLHLAAEQAATSEQRVALMDKANDVRMRVPKGP